MGSSQATVNTRMTRKLDRDVMDVVASTDDEHSEVESITIPTYRVTRKICTHSHTYLNIVGLEIIQK